MVSSEKFEGGRVTDSLLEEVRVADFDGHEIGGLGGHALGGAPEEGLPVVDADFALSVSHGANLWLRGPGDGNGSEADCEFRSLRRSEPSRREESSLETDVGHLLVGVEAHGLDEGFEFLNVAAPVCVLGVPLKLEAEVIEADDRGGGWEGLVELGHVHGVLRVLVSDVALGDVCLVLDVGLHALGEVEDLQGNGHGVVRVVAD